MHGASNDAVLPSFLFKNFAKNPRLKNNYARIYQEDKEISREIEAKEINTQQIHSFFQFSKILTINSLWFMCFVQVANINLFLFWFAELADL